MLVTSEKRQIIEKYKFNEKDNGSTQVQVALLTTDIKKLTEHFKTHKKDHHSRRGLLNKVSRRRKLLKYLYNKNVKLYRDLIAKLEIRDSLSRAK